ncbi:PilT protein domain protein [Thalassoporum mexicanum PCC 7367]|uniref:PIN/TRAM domain-containing protein n=1 Tax=Thalassoporum mexicanum TaxID=3457544 RepID=UPI00029FBD87|nr:PIN/TRAM domain-containing protein [Pseudanabaena sp. PCC 7367]AFY69372.1 PilT protein domain protein [Pseudanabaena sp. PCC 7367]
MLDALIVITFILAGAGTGFHGIDLLPIELIEKINTPGLHWVCLGFGSFFGLIMGLLVQNAYRRLEVKVRSLSLEILLSRAVGLVVGLLVANLMLAPLFLVPIAEDFAFFKPLAAILVSILFAYTGMTLMDTHGRAMMRLINPNNMESSLIAEGTLKPAATKVVDTSCVIDGRIESLMQTGFLEGQFLIPQFVIQELQTIADSSNDQKRIRGRRGLDILNDMREEFGDRIVIHSADYDDLSTVDAKLVRLAQEIDGTLVTNDYNLNKVASLQQIEVLNINDLAQALRPTYLPGDTLNIKVLKEGKEPAQGVGYLSDGTMVVVEEGMQHMGKQLGVVVTSALQTSAGRMIFARPEAIATV